MNIEEYPDVASLSDNSVDEFVPIETILNGTYNLNSKALTNQ